MTRQDAIDIRQRQLQGQAVSTAELVEAMAVLQVVEPKAKKPKAERKPRVGPTRAYGGTKRDRMRTDNKQVKLLKAELDGRP